MATIIIKILLMTQSKMKSRSQNMKMGQILVVDQLNLRKIGAYLKFWETVRLLQKKE